MHDAGRVAAMVQAKKVADFVGPFLHHAVEEVVITVIPAIEGVA